MPFEHYLLIYLFTTLGASYGIVFGGGSFVILPILFLLGVDPRVAIATNHASAMVQIGTGITVFGRAGKIDYKLALRAAPFFLAGGIIGAFLLLELNEEMIRKAVSLAVIFFAFFSLARKERLTQGKTKVSFLSIFFGSLLVVLAGIYQIIITAGGGTILTFVLVYLFGARLKGAIYTRPLINLATVLTATIILIWNGLVDWTIFIPLALGRGTGAFIGSKVLMHTKSEKLVIVFSVVVILIALRTLLG